MYYRLNRKTSRIETNLLEWKRSWKNVKILTYPTRFANELRLGPDPGGQRDATGGGHGQRVLDPDA